MTLALSERLNPATLCTSLLLLPHRWGSEKKAEEYSAEGAAAAAGGEASGSSSSGANGGNGSDAAGSNALVPNSAEHMHRKVRMPQVKGLLFDRGSHVVYVRSPH